MLDEDPIVPDSDVPPLVHGIDRVTSISVDEDHACAVRDDATVWCFGESDFSVFGQEIATLIRTPTEIHLPERN